MIDSFTLSSNKKKELAEFQIISFRAFEFCTQDSFLFTNHQYKNLNHKDSS